MRSNKFNKIAKTLPAWVLVALILAMGSGWAYDYYCPRPVYRPCCNTAPTIDIDQENYGNGHDRNNFADASIDYDGGWGGYYGGYGGRIDIDQSNVGNGNHRDNVAYASWSW